MALQLTKTTAYGPQADYWRVTAFSYMAPSSADIPPNGDVDYALPVVNALVALYTNADDSAAGKQEFESLNVMLNVTLGDTNFVEQIYAHLKTLFEFEDAVDV